MYCPILSNSLEFELSSIIFTIDEPIITPSEHFANSFASSVDLIPNPARVGTDAYFIFNILLISSIFKFDEPVTPLRVT